MITRRATVAGLGAALVAGCTGAPADPRRVVIGASPTGVPFSYVDPDTNQLTGAMVDIAAQLTRQLGLHPEFRIVPFSGLVPSLMTGRIDLIAAAMLRTPAREALVGFSAPVFAYAGGLAVRNDARGVYPDLAALRPLRVGTQIGTRFVDQLREAGVNQVSTYQGLGDMLRDLSHGRIDAAYGDDPILRMILRIGPRWAVHMPAEFHGPGKEQLCLIARKGSPLLARIDGELGGPALGRIAPVLKRWGLEPSEGHA
ncbi:substrate-binding periplasmic protein [Novosphingobium sp.]|uniref:substrate-binding periplasmic protein n=1 Tax=Novosphingobium sp. TaxID=1874826 RepID=UPI003B518D59